MKWGKVTGASKYRIFYKTGNGSWTVIGTTAYINFTDIKATKGKTYTYIVRCMNSNASSYTSGYYASGKSATFVSKLFTQ